jgi:hypothetical protein
MPLLFKFSIAVVLIMALTTPFSKTDAKLNVSDGCHVTYWYQDICVYAVEGNSYVASHCLNGANAMPLCPGVPPPDEP